MNNSISWIYREDKTPKDKSVYRKNGKPRQMTNGLIEVFVDSLYTDKKIGIKKKKVYKK